MKGFKGLLVLFFFIALGFCPLRNTLIAVITHHPVKRSINRSAWPQRDGNIRCSGIDAGWLTSGKTSETVPAAGILSEINLKNRQSFYTLILVRNFVTSRQNTTYQKVPIYLRKRCFLI